MKTLVLMKRSREPREHCGDQEMNLKFPLANETLGAAAHHQLWQKKNQDKEAWGTVGRQLKIKGLAWDSQARATAQAAAKRRPRSKAAPCTANDSA